MSGIITPWHAKHSFSGVSGVLPICGGKKQSISQSYLQSSSYGSTLRPVARTNINIKFNRNNYRVLTPKNCFHSLQKSVFKCRYFGEKIQRLLRFISIKSPLLRCWLKGSPCIEWFGVQIPATTDLSHKTGSDISSAKRLVTCVSVTGHRMLPL